MKLFKILFPAFAALVSVIIPAAASAQTNSADDITAQISNLPADKIISVAHLLLDTPLAGNEETVEGYGQVILLWLTNSDDYTVTLNPLQAIGPDPAIVRAYLAAEIINMDKLGINKSDKSSFIATMKDVLKYYLVNKDAIGRIPELSKLSRTPAGELDRKLGKMYKASMH